MVPIFLAKVDLKKGKKIQTFRGRSSLETQGQSNGSEEKARNELELDVWTTSSPGSSPFSNMSAAGKK